MMALRGATATLFLAITWVSQTAVAQNIDGTVMLNGQPVPDVTVTLWGTAGEEAPQQLATASSGADGSFSISDDTAPEDSVLYIVARDDAKQLALLSVLGTKPPERWSSTS